jgi:hypothetical protein
MLVCRLTQIILVKTFNPYLGVLHHEGVGIFNLVYMESFRVVCRNDRAMPEGFPAAYWIEKDQVYTVVEASLLARQNMVVGYKLAEIEIPEDCVYKFFLAMRFTPYNELDAKAEEAVAELLKEVDDLILV